MKKKQYIVTITCLLAGIIGFASVYATEKGQERKLAKEQMAKEESEELDAQAVSKIVAPRQKQLAEDTYEKSKTTADSHQETAESSLKEQTSLVGDLETKEELYNQNDLEDFNLSMEEAQVEENLEAIDPTAPVEDLARVEPAGDYHFEQSKSRTWPLEGEILLDYSMDASIYFPTLDQYKYNPAVIIGGNVNDKVYLFANGTISDIYTDEETGTTVVEDLGDGYQAIYGQLKETNFAVGDQVDAGQVIGYINEPTKYYANEGSNLYFALKKDGKPVNPSDYMEAE